MLLKSTESGIREWSIDRGTVEREQFPRISMQMLRGHSSVNSPSSLLIVRPDALVYLSFPYNMRDTFPLAN